MRYLNIPLLVCLVACGSTEEPSSGDLVGANAGGAGDVGSNAAGSGGSPTSGGSINTGGSAASGGVAALGGSSGSGGSKASGGSGGSGGSVGGGGSGAGSGGSGGSGAIVVTACDRLPSAGQWQEISPAVFHSPSNMETLSVVVNQSDQSVFAAAGNKTNGGNSGTGVYKSTDCGATWKLVSTGTNADKLMTGDPWAMLIDPLNPRTMYVNNGYGQDATIYKSTNGGVDWSELLPMTTQKTAPFVEDIALEPANPQHLAVTFHENCPTPYNAMCLSQSTDGGATWQMFNGPSQLGGWQEAATLTILGATSYLYMAEGAWYTSDGGKTWSEVIKQHFGGGYSGSTDLAPDGTLYLAGTNPLFSSGSNPLGSSWTKVGNSPNLSSVKDDGVSLFGSYSWDNSGQPFYTAKLSNPTVWTHMQTPQIGRGSDAMAYDATHHIMYSANWSAGLWRLVTR